MWLILTMSHSFSLLYSIPWCDYVAIYLLLRLRIGVCITSRWGSGAYAATNILCVSVPMRIHFRLGAYLGADSPVRGACAESALIESAERSSEAFMQLSTPRQQSPTCQLCSPSCTWCFLAAALVRVFDSNLHVSDDQSLSLFRCDWVDFVEASAYFF